MIGTPAALITYAAARGVTVGEDEAPILLVKATDYMNTFDWTGKKPAGQEDSWPRENIVFDGTPVFNADGDQITVIEHSDGTKTELEEGDVIETPAVTPQTVFTATYRVALAIAEGNDVTAVSAGGKVKQETVSGAVSITYADGTESNPIVIPGLNQLINPWLNSALYSGLNFNVMRG